MREEVSYTSKAADLKRIYAFMWRPVQLDREIRRKCLRVDELRMSLLPVGITYDGDRVQTSPGDRMAVIMSEILELETQIRTLQENRATAILEIGAALDRLGDPAEACVLEYYYIGGMPVHTIADEMGYSVSHIYRLKRQGIQKMIKNDKLICDTI